MNILNTNVHRNSTGP